MSSISFTPFITNAQFIHGWVSTRSSEGFFLTTVYPKNVHSGKLELWDVLSKFYNTIQQAWIVLGDFNYYRFPEEKKGDNPISPSKLMDFNPMPFNFELRDLSFSLSYTCHNNRIDNPIHIKLDRVLINDYWLNDLLIS